MSDDLVAFLRARLEDSAWLHDLRDPLPSQRRAYALSSCVELLTDAEAVHIARHDPERVLAEVDAKRRIIDPHNGQHECTDLRASEYAYVGCETLRLLALPYAGDPNYRDEWRP